MSWLWGRGWVGGVSSDDGVCLPPLQLVQTDEAHQQRHQGTSGQHVVSEEAKMCAWGACLYVCLPVRLSAIAMWFSVQSPT